MLALKGCCCRLAPGSIIWRRKLLPERNAWSLTRWRKGLLKGNRDNETWGKETKRWNRLERRREGEREERGEKGGEKGKRGKGSERGKKGKGGERGDIGGERKEGDIGDGRRKGASLLKSCTKRVKSSFLLRIMLKMLHFNANRNLFCNFVLRTAVITKFSFPKI